MTDVEVHDPSAEGSTALAHELADVARILLTPATVAVTVHQIVQLSVVAISGCDEAGLCTSADVPGQVEPSSVLVAELNELQNWLGEGPSIDVLAGSESVYAEDLSEAERWPRFGPRAAKAGFHSALAYRLAAGTDTLGVLQLLAAHAGMALSAGMIQATQRSHLDDLSAHFQTALLSREVIGQAQGILMERERITADQAFVLLRRSSQQLNIKLRDVAQELVETGAVPLGRSGRGTAPPRR